MIEQGLLQLITGNSNVSALVGAKVYWILAPKGSVVPYIVLSRVSTSDVYTYQGATGFRNALFQASCYATDYYTSRAVALTVRMLLENYLGNLPDVNATAVAATLIEKDFDMQYEEGAKGFVYCGILQFRVWYYDSALPINTPSGPPVVIDGGSF